MEKIILFLIANQFITNLLVLPIVIALNIYLGWAIADFKKTIDKEKFRIGLKKGVAVYVAIAVLSGITKVLSIAEIDLMPTLAVMVYAMLLFYLKQIIEKIATILGYKAPNKEGE